MYIEEIAGHRGQLPYGYLNPRLNIQFCVTYRV